jgi:phosphoribosylformimino-5-aminoimidazole carboxamide ribotide isomerase
MIIIPAIDIRNGKVTQLTQGKAGTEKYYGDPIETAKTWEKKGAKILHVIDLDATIGDAKGNLSTVLSLQSEVKIPIQFGGGIRSYEAAKKLLDAGIGRIILGSLAVKDPEVVKRLSKEYGKKRILVAVDAIGGNVVIKGWKEKTKVKTIDLIKKLEPYCFGFLVTDVDREGMMQGIDKSEFKELASKTDALILAAGGITTTDDLKELKKMGIFGCVIGKALYEGTIDFKLEI